MCGLVGIIRLDGHDARKTALKRYDAQSHRGSDGFGFVAIKDDVMIKHERSETEDEIKALLALAPCDTLIFHHRIPTSTPNLKECNHPIKVSHSSLSHDYYVIHNGIIWDAESKRLKDKHEKQGFTYTTEVKFTAHVGDRSIPIQTKWNDSEALAIELAQDVDKDGDGIVAEGSIAFIAIKVNKETGKIANIFWGTNGGSPLKFFEVRDTMITICSEGAGEEVKEHTLYSLDFTSGEISDKPYKVGRESATISEATTFYLDEDYYELIEEQEDLRRQRLILENAGRDTDALDEAIEALEFDLQAFETGYDRAEATRLLNS